MGLEILRNCSAQHLKRLHAIFVPVGGGGMLAGIASYVKAVNPDVKVFGVEPTGLLTCLPMHRNDSQHPCVLMIIILVFSMQSLCVDSASRVSFLQSINVIDVILAFVSVSVLVMNDQWRSTSPVQHVTHRNMSAERVLDFMPCRTTSCRCQRDGHITEEGTPCETGACGCLC